MTALIVDDERIARQELRRLLGAHPEVEIAGEAANGEEALALIQRIEPDVLFLDIQMPGMSGFDLLARLAEVPEVIFTTAYDQHALQAFDANALDYLLKPIAPGRLAAALQKLRGRRDRPRIEKLFLRDGERCWIVGTEEIDLLESDGNYTRVLFRKERPLVPGTLASFEDRLNPAAFFRASRKHLINLNSIEAAELSVGGNLVVRMRGGHEVELSRRQSAHLREILSL
ncbi:MAG TPA: response regulator [Bryobacteraceae bacterium]|jgi:two-component system LytT family response regulator|nr:response regulator [Bryobacteraceae bacterium]